MGMCIPFYRCKNWGTEKSCLWFILSKLLFPISCTIGIWIKTVWSQSPYSQLHFVASLEIYHEWHKDKRSRVMGRKGEIKLWWFFKIWPQIVWSSSLQEVEANFFSLECGPDLLSLQIEEGGREGVLTSKSKIETMLRLFLFSLCLGAPTLGNTSCHVTKTLNRLQKMSTWWGTRAFCRLPASTCQICERATSEGEYSAPVKRQMTTALADVTETSLSESSS